MSLTVRTAPPASPASANAKPVVGPVAVAHGSAVPGPGPERRWPNVKNLLQLTFDPIGAPIARTMSDR